VKNRLFVEPVVYVGSVSVQLPPGGTAAGFSGDASVEDWSK
jgi:hypothetical protein